MSGRRSKNTLSLSLPRLLRRWQGCVSSRRLIYVRLSGKFGWEIRMIRKPGIGLGITLLSQRHGDSIDGFGCLWGYRRRRGCGRRLLTEPSKHSFGGALLHTWMMSLSTLRSGRTTLSISILCSTWQGIKI